VGSNPAGPTIFFDIRYIGFYFMKKTVLLLFGGKSPEHEISIKTAYNVVNALDKNLFNYILVGISRTGVFYFLTDEQIESLANLHGEILDNQNYPHACFLQVQQKIYLNDTNIDVVFPLLHGGAGEDGAPQGFFNMLNIPFVGNDTKSSAVCMDKDFTKKLLRTEDIPVVNWMAIREGEPFNSADIINTFGLPLFVKAAEQGSSVGTYKVKNGEDLTAVIEKTFRYGKKVIIEPFVAIREIEVAVLGNSDNIKVSAVGEIIVSKNHEFYSYESKYVDPHGAIVDMNPIIKPEIKEKIRDYALKAFKVLECTGLARIDFFLTTEDEVYLNEINTMPGFTNISMYPKLWMNQEISYENLITTLLNLAFEHFNKKQSYLLV
jgi:D-alanine-D-alanine ligase